MERKPKPNGSSESSESSEVCVICLEDFIPENGKVYRSECNHVFHEKCIAFLANVLCPLCRRDMKLPESMLSVMKDTETLFKLQGVEEGAFEYFRSDETVENIPIETQGYLALIYLEKIGISNQIIAEAIEKKIIPDLSSTTLNPNLRPDLSKAENVSEGSKDIFSRIVISVINFGRRKLDPLNSFGS